MKVSVILPCLFTDEWQPILAKFSIETMLIRTQIEFELVVVETGSEIMSEFCEYDFRYFSPCIYVNKPEKTSYTKDFNSGIEASSGEFIVHTAPDVIVGDRWLEAMLACFDIHDCGVSTVAIKEGGHVLGMDKPHASIVESFYGAIMMFRRDMRFDESFPDQMSDYDLCMQIYDKGLRSYRNNISQAFHMKLEHGIGEDENARRFQHGVTRFGEKWRDKHWLIKDLIFRGGVNYGAENR